MARRLALRSVEVDLDDGRVLREGEAAAQLSATERRLLAYLAAREGAPVSREVLLVDVFGYHPSAVTRTVDVAVQRLRRKIERRPKDPEHVLTVYGIGYRFEPAAPRAEPLLGRAGALSELRAALDRSPLVTLTGPPGVGKSRLAAQLLAGPEAAARWRPGEPLPAAALLLLDGPEADLKGAARSAAGAIAAGRRLLVASRERLRISGERLVHLPPLAPEAARDLFLRRARRAAPDYAAPPGDLDALLDRLDRLPASILRAAELAPDLPLEALARRVDLDPDLGPCWSRLSADERRALRALSEAGPRSFREAAALLEGLGLSEAPIAIIESLLDRSLLALEADRRLRPWGAARRYAFRAPAGGPSADGLSADGPPGGSGAGA